MFESWSDIIGGILLNAGIPGFLNNLESFYEDSDTEGQAWRTLMGVWWRKFKDKQIGVSQVYELAFPPEGDPLDLGIPDGNERSQKTSLGRLLSARRDRQFGNFRLSLGREKHNAKLWYLKKIDEKK